MSKLPSLTGVELTPQVSDLGVALVHQRSPGKSGPRVLFMGRSFTPTRGSGILTPGGLIGGSDMPANSFAVGPTATGDGTGRNWNNTRAWGSTTFVRGGTYYVAGGSYAARTYNTAGTARITIRKATASDHGTDTGWTSSMAGVAAFTGTQRFTTSNWTFDGVTGGGPGQWLSGHGFETTQTTVNAQMFYIDGASGIEILHTKLIGMNRTGTFGGAAANDGIASVNSGSFRASHCWFFGVGRCPVWTPEMGPIGFTVEHSYVDQFNFGSAIHGEVASVEGPTSAAARQIWRWNIITDIQSTGGIMWDNENSGAECHIYGNVFYRPPGRTWADAGNGICGGWTGGNGEVWRNMKVYNNTFYNCQGSQAFPVVGFNTTPTGHAARNNLFVACGGDVEYGSYWATHDYNAYINSGGLHGEATGFSGTVDPIPSPASLDFTPGSSVSIPSGIDLPVPFNVDMYGNTRQPGNWTRGAIQKV